MIYSPPNNIKAGDYGRDTDTANPERLINLIFRIFSYNRIIHIMVRHDIGKQNGQCATKQENDPNPVKEG